MKKINGKWALITGASSGIGSDLTRLFAKEGCPMILTARRKERLETIKNQIKNEYNVEVETISNDLSKKGGPEELYNSVKELGHQVSILVNNAGVGLGGKFADQDLEDQLSIIQLNTVSVTELTKRFLKDMLEKNEGWILQLGSTFSFHPGPNFAVYAATKAYILSLSESLNHELRDTGIKHTVLCPGATRTEFFEASKTPDNALLETIKMDSKIVAKIGFDALLEGKPYVVPGLHNKLITQGQKFSPRAVTLFFLDFLFGKK
jgi:hypothetical protein